MYAHLDKAGDGRDHAGAPGLLGSVSFRQLAGSAEWRLTFWDTEASATAYRSQHARLAALPGEVYQVTDAREGAAAGQAPACARLMHFDGPRTPEQAAAADLAGRHRIWPVIRGVHGLVGLYVLRRRDLADVVITLATSVETLDAVARAAMSTGLMPGEDPALLPGPDRIEIHHVTDCHLPTSALADSTEGR